jgi:hypothetical protein
VEPVMKKVFTASKDWLIEKYAQEGLSGPQIAKLAGVSHNTVYYWLSIHGIKRRSPLPAEDWREKFWNRVKMSPGDGCWEWGAGRDGRNYGQMNVDGRPRKASRLAYESAYGPFDDSLCVLHKCDNPPCCRPDHLFLGTKTDNAADRGAKNRTCHGEAKPAAKLTEAAVLRIMSLRGTMTKRAVAKLFGVGETTIYQIFYGQTWKHVTGVGK